jgi:hypothetical protein
MDDGLGFFGNLALGRIAGAIDANADAQATVNFFEGLRHRQEIEAHESAINEVVLQYNQLVQEFNRVVGVARQWMNWGEEKKSQIAQLKQELATASQRARDAEAREADVRERYDAAEAYIVVLNRQADRRVSEVNNLLIEIEHLKRR